MEVPEELINMLRFFVKRRNYSYVDRIGNALTVQPVEMALKDALRDLITIYGSSNKDERGFHFIINDRGEKEYLPKIPSKQSVEEFLKKAKEDISIARRLAIFALTY